VKRLPCDLEAERALCGAALLDAGVLDAVDVRPDQFFDLRLRKVWTAMQSLHAEGAPLDEITIPDRAVTGVDVGLLVECAGSRGLPSNVDHYAEIVRRHALTRDVLVAMAELTERHNAGQLEGKDLLDATLAAITRIDTGRAGSTVTIGDLIRRRMKQLDDLTAARARGDRLLPGVPTGIPSLDDETGGFPLGQITILGARPGMGKSAFLLETTEAAARAGYGVHVFSIEDTQEVYTDRALSQESGVPGASIRGQLNRLQLEQLARGAARLFERKNWLYEEVAGVSAEEIVRAVRRKRSENKTKLVIVDYLQLVRRPKRYESVHDAIGQSLAILADAAKQDGIAYLVASQLNRKIEERQDKRPKLSDMRESGSIEERAKLILALYRGSYYGDPQKGVDYNPNSDDPRERYEPSGDEWRRRLDVYLLKHSQGESNSFVRCDFDGPTLQIREAESA
jgi:replicative DNA helicase